MSAPTAVASSELRGREDFAGTVIDGFEEVLGQLDQLDGMRVALVGDPVLVTRLASRLAERASVLKVFQRDPVWVLPRVLPVGLVVAVARSLVPDSLHRRMVGAVATRHLRQQIGDRWIRRQLTPSGGPTNDNVVYSNRYYRVLRRDDVELITWPIAGVVPEGIRTADGLEHHVDAIVTV